MKEQGLEFSLDDFGMGHNSLVQLQEGCFNEVKIDGNLVSQLPNNKSTREIISGIVQMSQNLNCRTIAEFVETEEQRDMLLSLGCGTADFLRMYRHSGLLLQQSPASRGIFRIYFPSAKAK